MKTKSILPLMISIVLLNINRSFSQIALNRKPSNDIHLIPLGTNAGVDTGVNIHYLNAFASSIRVQRSFISYFGETAENNWSMVGKNYLNRFYTNGLLTNALFTKNGRLIYMIIYGTEKNLPTNLRKIVKREYYDYAITMAIEVKEDNRNIWIIKSDNAKEQITVRIEDGEMEKVQQFQKTN